MAEKEKLKKCWWFSNNGTCEGKERPGTEGVKLCP
jgi:hypothetical protein